MQLRISEPIFNKEKAREIILYILNKYPAINEETLYNMLYFIDFDYYETFEKHLIGFTWGKNLISWK